MTDCTPSPASPVSGPRAGVTLIELIIAISLVSLISVGVLTAMHVGLNAMEKTNSRVMLNRRAIGAQRVIEQQIAGMIVTTADCRVAPSAPPVRLPFFEGQPQTMRFVSSFSLQEASRGYPRILEYQVASRPDGQGVRLIVNELLYYGPYSTGQLCLGPGPPNSGTLFKPVLIGPQSFVLADKLAYCRFAYQQDAPPPALKEWVPVWSNKEFPSAVRIEVAPLTVDPAGVPMVNMIIPVRVNAFPGTVYVD